MVRGGNGRATEAVRDKTKWAAALAAYHAADTNWPVAHRDESLSTGLNLLHVRQSAALAALAGCDVAGYRLRGQQVADAYVNTTDPNVMLAVLWLLTLEPLGDGKAHSPLLLPIGVYNIKIQPHYKEHLSGTRWGRYAKVQYEVWSSHPPAKYQVGRR